MNLGGVGWAQQCCARDCGSLVSRWTLAGTCPASGSADSGGRAGRRGWPTVAVRGVCAGVFGRSESGSRSAGGAGDRVGNRPADSGRGGRRRGGFRAERAPSQVSALRDPSVHRIVVEHRDRFCRFGSEYVQAALAAQGRELVVVDAAEVDDDLVRDMTKILASMCTRLYGKRAAGNRAKRALAAAAATEEPGAA
jgi:hypothetical protein